jgi:hypothetical protein
MKKWIVIIAVALCLSAVGASGTGLGKTTIGRISFSANGTQWIDTTTLVSNGSSYDQAIFYQPDGTYVASGTWPHKVVRNLATDPMVGEVIPNYGGGGGGGGGGHNEHGPMPQNGPNGYSIVVVNIGTGMIHSSFRGDPWTCGQIFYSVSSAQIGAAWHFDHANLFPCPQTSGNVPSQLTVAPPLVWSPAWLHRDEGPVQRMETTGMLEPGLQGIPASERRAIKEQLMALYGISAD